ncbi:hypothetical protein ICN18_07315 [Polynucleobacter sp. Ross1-W9]|uniref:hypothetical protein n=1 Tax=Polynucleobacter parvulilacunae TaxID=1855631 RepID=UPI001C0CC654|nr:hypothetical protein [Polynucleobacter parvulilacunae]MBU3557434.1 hypothetical protein [Polynucleobacter parvulilacunae]
MNAVNLSTTGFNILATWSANSQSSPLLNTFLHEDIENFLCSCRRLGMPISKLDFAVKVLFLGSQATLFPQQTQSITSLQKFLRLGSTWITLPWSALIIGLALASLVMEAPKM